MKWNPGSLDSFIVACPLSENRIPLFRDVLWLLSHVLFGNRIPLFRDML
jgi:hypothetical protein